MLLIQPTLKRISHYKKRVKYILKRNIAVATTTKLLLFSLFIALFIALASFFVIQNHQKQTIRDTIAQLASTVENTASIATFTNDEVLAKEVLQGLSHNKAIRAATILSHNKILSAVGDFSAGNQRNTAAPNTYEKKLVSPFDKNEAIGTLVIEINTQKILKDSIAYAKFVSIILFSLTFIIAISLAIAINLNIIQPIRFIANKLHSMDIENLSLIETPNQHEHDEIGRLVADINQLTHQQKALIRSEKNLRIAQEFAQQRVQLIFEKNQNGLFISDHRLNLAVWNSALENLLGIKIKINENNNLNKILSKHQDAIQQLLQKVTQQKPCDNLILNISNSPLQQQWIEISLQILDKNSLQGIISDANNHKKLEMLALAMAEQDALTGLLNRRGFEYQCNAHLSRCAPDHGIGLLLIDLDGFKDVNDHFGHHAGDFVLTTVSQRLSTLLRPEDVLSRLGGDEFVVIISKLKNTDDACSIAKKMIEVISAPIYFENNQLNVGASIGITTNYYAQQHLTVLLKQADSAMYKAKHAGKGQFSIYRDNIAS